MRPGRRRWWLGYGGCVLVVLAAMVWLSRTVLELERSRLAAREEARRQEPLRLALWRMESWFLPVLARESARPYFEYQAYFPANPSFGVAFPQSVPGDVLQPSPLLTFQSEFLRLHFQVDPGGTFSSPQLPEAPLRALAIEACLSGEMVARRESLLEQVARWVDVPEVRRRIAAAEARERDTLEAPAAQLPDVVVGGPEELQNQREWSARAKNTYETKLQAAQSAEIVQTLDAEVPLQVHGSFVPLWLGDQLFFFRRVDLEGVELLQGISLDWPRLAAELLAQVEDLAPGAALVPVPEGTANPLPMQLASIPAALQPGPFPDPGSPGFTTTRATLLLAWLFVAAALAAAAVTLHSSAELGDRRARFASAVSHELRTPLTTFKMYAEMLAEDMVAHPEKRRQYLATLHQEATRLSLLVENVLVYSRLEEGRATFRKQELTCAALVERVAPVLGKRAADSGMQLEVTADGTSPRRVSVDVEAVQQILFNLVDNSCKYAARNGEPTLRLEAAWTPAALELRVRDHGPGVPAAIARRVFQPFERAEPGGTTPGLGLGLAIARGLAQDLGGELTLEPGNGKGACFRLTLPG